ncbi:zinc-ribbon domain-containing protein [Gemmata sp. JC717]|uniref:zinc-ribbon domain-containing protein n=1 Tax=Gemmata algarum TaxID=2975278 RepID=UPI0021BAE1A5|nr:zinc-ribbon domain-containing protein [Gemmata algarum]MDY3554085.1 zinc-ribbon domain-containing protein [Gemmata algarum]
MARTRIDDPDDEDGDEYDAEHDYDPDDPETYPQGVYLDDERALVPCPHCRAEIDEESEQCPRCGMFLSAEDAPPGQKSRFTMAMLLLALFAALIMARGC